METVKSTSHQAVIHTKWKKLKVFVWLLSFVKKYRLSFFALILASFIQSGVQLLIPKFIQQVIDIIIPSRDFTSFYQYLGLLLPLVAVMLIAMAVRNYAQRVVQEKSSNELQLSLFRHLRKLGFSYYERNPAGETLSLFHAEIPAIQSLYRRYLPLLIERIILLSISIVFLIFINPQLTLLIIPCFLSYYLIGPYFEKKQSHYSELGVASRTEYNKKLYDSVSALLELRIHQAEQWDLERLEARYEKNRTNWKTELLHALLRGTTRRMTINLGAVLLFVFGAITVKSGGMLVGEFVAFLLYYFYVMGGLTLVVTLITEQSMLLHQGEKLYDLIKLKPEVEEVHEPIHLHKISGCLSLTEVEFGYLQNHKILNGITLEVAAGQRVALVGTSGGGKSTLLKLIGRFYDPTSGLITLDGYPIDQLRLEDLRSSLGYVFQETYLFGASVRENIRFGNPEVSEEAIINAARAAYAHEFILSLPDGYDTNVGERGVKLSGGQKQRIAIARMLLKNPSIVLLDEATSALDHMSEREVQQAFDRLLQGRTTIAVAHRLSTVRDYDVIVVLENGIIAERGSFDELMARKGTLYQLVQGEEVVYV